MAINPMERKTRNSFITGLVIGLFIAALVGVLGYLQIMNLNKEKKSTEKNLQSVFVAKNDILANQEITSENLVSEKLKTKIDTSKIVTAQMLSEISGGKVAMDNGQIVGKKNKFAISLPISNQSGNQTEKPKENVDAKQTETKPSVNEDSIIVAKIDIPAGSIVTTDMIIKKVYNKAIQEHTRLMEYTSIVLPTELKEKETVDIRIAFPNGQDLIVASKKTVEKTDANSITLRMNEEEIIQMNSAVIESYLVEGAKLYAAQYTDPGIQGASKATYTANQEVINLLSVDPNVSATFKNGISEYSNKRILINNIVEKAKQNESADSRVTTGVEKEKKDRQDKRTQFLTGGEEVQ